MSTTQQKPLQRAVSFHAWNADNSMVAISPNSEEVWIYKTGGKFESDSWGREPDWKLKEHGGYVSGIDWHHGTNTLVTCGHDRNAYVWKLEGNEWKPTLVILRINRAATDVKWSPNGQKFAVASGAKCVPICHFEESNDWWISKMVKKHKSTVTSVAWSPNSKYIVTGSCDFKCRILSAYIEGLDDPAPDDFTGMWANAHEFGEELAVYEGAGAWVNNVAWSPNGARIAYAGHGSSLHFVDFAATSEQRLLSKSLPYLLCEFLSDTALVAVGFDNNPHVYTLQGDSWVLAGEADDKKDSAVAAPAKKKFGGFGSAMDKFKEADTRGQKFGAATVEAVCLTRHKNTVVDLKVQAGGRVSTSSLCGRILSWDVSSLAK